MVKKAATLEHSHGISRDTGLRGRSRRRKFHRSPATTAHTIAVSRNTAAAKSCDALSWIIFLSPRGGIFHNAIGPRKAGASAPGGELAPRPRRRCHTRYAQRIPRIPRIPRNLWNPLLESVVTLGFRG